MWIGIISLFPDMFKIITDYGVIGKGITKGFIKLQIWNPRDFTYKKRCIIDDRPYGGGPGMIMMFQPLFDAICAAKIKAGNGVKVIYLTPQGRKVDQKTIISLYEKNKLILVCGRYKGIDERLVEDNIDEELSIGDYVLSGGELPAMILIDAIARLIPGVLGKYESVTNDSFFNGLLDCPHYTRPKVLQGKQVPEILLSGKHCEIYRWRLKQSLGRTWLRRPELLKKIILSQEELQLLIEFKRDINKNIVIK
ncbi:tRNA (guanosine(37)-N1)-methyltransferase TrmD [Candidatus Pantoea edessiphila]|uniref:tRNA (guanine-N(1)-)-methyltransferase n=1 Tax=Candidatus Pantoea edessiphila TaxID=2044610 RepID=A0A2P5SXS7_9GAMM|nr:tRNA (guanosine(37)-N1)-methyltransferase TrmD [Candidatus Pantoea edessiphila]MBK4775666.1 tRNA (guanosine(37)-N1)-methyltransferase TrmD [Pantoea sp. Edef]PPI87102.1 tRNA (guanosine(37)-N1)-methyltransferase TrmD [Candidatus Pantoea edessiphila]